MRTKAIDIVLPPAKDALEDWQRWQNRVASDLARLSIRRRKIEVKNG